MYWQKIAYIKQKLVKHTEIQVKVDGGMIHHDK